MATTLYECSQIWATNDGKTPFLLISSIMGISNMLMNKHFSIETWNVGSLHGDKVLIVYGFTRVKVFTQ